MPNPAGRPRVFGDVSLICRECFGTFSMRNSEARGYEKKHGHQKPFCSMNCFYQNKFHRDAGPDAAAPTFECLGCGKTTVRRRQAVGGSRSGSWDNRQKYCTMQCSLDARRAKERPPTAGFINQDGYRVLHVGNGKKLTEHRIIMAKLLGRDLRKNENIHHLNGSRSDNRPENLELWVKTQPCGQRVTDVVRHALNILNDYPEVSAAFGYELIERKSVSVVQSDMASVLLASAMSMSS